MITVFFKVTIVCVCQCCVVLVCVVLTGSVWSAGPPLLPAVVEGVTSLSPNSAASLTQLPTAQLPVEENNGASLCAAYM